MDPIVSDSRFYECLCNSCAGQSLVGAMQVEHYDKMRPEGVEHD